MAASKFINSAATTNAQVVSPSKAALGSLVAFNSGAGAAFVKLYDKASSPTVGTDTPVIVMNVPAGQSNGLLISLDQFRFIKGLALAITGAAADSDTTAVAANQVKVAIGYNG